MQQSDGGPVPVVKRGESLVACMPLAAAAILPEGHPEPDDRLRTLIEASVGQVFGIYAAEFSSVTRGTARVALARQVAMYLCHVMCQRSLTDVGRIFQRDRTTVAHACGVVEDLRDDPRFDRVLELLETIVRYRLTPRVASLSVLRARGGL